MSRIIGLTGGIGSGKSTVSRYLAKKGFDIVDADAIAREITAPGEEVLPVLAETFGADVLRADGRLDRKLLAERVFPCPQAKQRLDEIMHARILPRIIARTQASRASLCFMDVPLLFETGLDRHCDETWVVTADLATRIRRTAARDGTDERHIRERIASQMSDEKKIARADRVLDNSGTREELAWQSDELLKAYE